MSELIETETWFDQMWAIKYKRNNPRTQSKETDLFGDPVRIFQTRAKAREHIKNWYNRIDKRRTARGLDTINRRGLTPAKIFITYQLYAE